MKRRAPLSIAVARRWLEALCAEELKNLAEPNQNVRGVIVAREISEDLLLACGNGSWRGAVRVRIVPFP